MPSFRIMAFRVVRGRPRRVAAVLTTPPVSRKYPDDVLPLHLLQGTAGCGFHCL